MTYYINDIELENTFLNRRKSSDSWNVKTHGVCKFPFIERVGRHSTDFSVDLVFIGDNRYDVYTSVAADIDDCESILLYNDDSKKLYGIKEELWINPNNFSVVEEGSKIGDRHG